MVTPIVEEVNPPRLMWTVITEWEHHSGRPTASAVYVVPDMAKLEAQREAEYLADSSTELEALKRADGTWQIQRRAETEWDTKVVAVVRIQSVVEHR